MTVTMTIEEFDELRESKRTLEEVRAYLIQHVYYSSEAYICSCIDAWRFAKALPQQNVAMLVKCAGVYRNYKNVDQPEEEKA